MSVRFTSGGIGRLTFEHANRIAAATDRVGGMPIGSSIQSDKVRPDFIVARLVSQTSQTFGPSGYKVWTWTEIGVNGTPASRSIGSISKGLASTDFPEPLGRAVCIYGTGSPLDHVVLFPLKDVTGETWYAFVGTVTAVGTTSVLSLAEGPIETSPGVYRYQATPVYMNTTGTPTPNPNLPSGPAFNLYEYSNWHGQPRSFDSPPSTLVPDGPVLGYVLGVLANNPSDSVVWAFEAPLPLRSQCGEPPASVVGNALRGGI